MKSYKLRLIYNKERINMKLYVKLMSGEILTYTPRGVRGQRCKIETHKPHMEEMVLKYLDLSKDTHFVKLLTEDDEKEMDQIYYGQYVYRKSEYYEENKQENPIFAFAESYEDQKESYFSSCIELLNKASTLYYSLDENIRSLKEEDIYGENSDYYRYYDIYLVKNELEIAIWQMSNSLGIPIILSECDPQRNTVRKISKDPTKTILYYTRSIENCEKKLKEMREEKE